MKLTRHPVAVATRAPTGTTNAYVIGDRPAALVDPGGRTEELDRVVRARGVEHVLVTHTHPDHTGAVGDYANDLGATTWALRGRERAFERATAVEPDRTLRVGDCIRLGGGTLEVLETPGHAPDHCGFLDVETGSILVGDCVVAEGSVVVGAPEGDMRAYLTTLRRLRARQPPRLYPGHGPVVDDPQATLERLIAHRLRRERRIREAVAAGARTPAAILEAAYNKDLTGVRDLARATVVAHLEKLAVEADFEWTGRRVRTRDD